MGVEPTAACSVQPATDFEDRGAHQDTTTPIHSLAYLRQNGYIRVMLYSTNELVTQVTKPARTRLSL